MDKELRLKLHAFKAGDKANKQVRAAHEKLCKKMEKKAKKIFKWRVKPVFKKYEKLCKENHIHYVNQSAIYFLSYTDYFFNAFIVGTSVGPNVTTDHGFPSFIIRYDQPKSVELGG